MKKFCWPRSVRKKKKLSRPKWKPPSRKSKTSSEGKRKNKSWTKPAAKPRRVWWIWNDELPKSEKRGSAHSKTNWDKGIKSPRKWNCIFLHGSKIWNIGGLKKRLRWKRLSGKEK